MSPQDLTFVITPSTTLDEFTEAIKADSKFETVQPTSVRAIYDDVCLRPCFKIPSATASRLSRPFAFPLPVL